MYKKGLIGIVVLAVMVGGVAISLIPITFAASGSPQQISPYNTIKCPTASAGDTGRIGRCPTVDTRRMVWAPILHVAMHAQAWGWGYNANFYWNDRIPSMYRNYSLSYSR